MARRDVGRERRIVPRVHPQDRSKSLSRSEWKQGEYILRRYYDDKAEFLLISLWDSVESIKRFAGDDYHKAYYPFPEDKEFLIELEPEVKHFEVLEE